ncbi:MAG: enoyl-CoA hydratase [Microbacteriaceae bacterium]|nr:enoyl-CoA hydratase [Microbacteriaceae bacterium]
MTDFSEIRYEVSQDSARIVLDRPEHLNALTPVMARELLAAIRLAEADTAVRSIVITGSGSAFCAGAELTYFRERLAEPDGCERFIAELLQPLRDLVRAIAASPLPVIAAINGVCAAGGFELALRCDLVVASSTAVFMDAHSRRGLGPAIGGAAALVHAVGHQRALQILALSERVPAQAMFDYGVVTELCEPQEFDRRIGELTTTLARRSPRSIATMKRAAGYQQSPTLEQTLERDLAEFRAEWGSADMTEGVSAFVENRHAVFAR